jgi:glycine/D-amino acid oxidase-like deaminating enzyme
MTEKKEYLIVGAGLSGICMAIHLIKNNHSITLIDSGENFSTAVAAGQINPLVFRRMTKSWRVDDYLPYAEKFYTDLEIDTELPIYFPIQIRRMFSSAHEKVMWVEKQNREGFSDYLETITSEDDEYDLAQNDFGSGRIKKSSYVNAFNFVEGGKNWIKKRATIVTEKLDYSLIEPSSSSYKGKKYDFILFCEGSHNSDNPWFNQFIVEHTKGEVLTLKSDEISEHESLNRKCFLLPIGNKLFRLGATYVWNTPDRTLTQEAKDDLLDKVKLLTKKSFEVVDHQVGIRPTTPDRRPIIGKHPTFKNLLLFNGLGTKGYLMAPLLAKEFVDYLDFDKELDKEVRIERFIK